MDAVLPMNLSVSVQVVQALQNLPQYRGNDGLLERSIPLVFFACVLNYVKHRACKDIPYTHKGNFCNTPNLSKTQHKKITSEPFI